MRPSAAEGGRAWRSFATPFLCLAVLLTGAPAPAGAVEFENSKFRRDAAYGSSMVRAWEKGRSSAKASAFFLANKNRRLLVMTARHVVGRSPVFQYRGRRATSARQLLRDRDVAIYEVSFGGAVRYDAVGKFHIARGRPRLGQNLQVVGYPKGFSGALMVSRNCQLMPKNRMLHPTFFGCVDLDRWCDYARKANKSRTTCERDAKSVRRGRGRQCARPVAERKTRHERHAHSNYTMNCAVRLGSSGGPVILASSRRSRAVIGMPSAVFARVYGPFPANLGVGVATFSQGFKARAQRFGIVVR
ncbi:MAG: trypsin-like peptidase domain-containing protein [Pseudomonadota bacterium]